jgi:DNA replication protein DnaC
MNRRLVFELATGRFVTQHEDGLFQGPPGTGKSHLAQAIGLAVIQQGQRVLYREAHVLLDELADAQLAGTRKQYLAQLTTVPLLLIDDLAMRKLPHTAAEDLLEIVMRRYENASTLITFLWNLGARLPAGARVFSFCARAAEPKTERFQYGLIQERGKFHIT